MCGCTAGVAPTCAASALGAGVFFVSVPPVNRLTKTFTGFCNGIACICTGALTNGWLISNHGWK